MARGSGTSDFLYLGGSADETNMQNEFYLSITALNVADGSISSQFFIDCRSGGDTFWDDVNTARYISHMNFWVEPGTGDHYLFGGFESNGWIDNDGILGIWKVRNSNGVPTDNVEYKAYD